MMSRAAALRLELHSSYARPAPNPAPMNAGNALRLKSRTEKTTPKPRPRVDLMIRLERQRSHCDVHVLARTMDACLPPGSQRVDVGCC